MTPNSPKTVHPMGLHVLLDLNDLSYELCTNPIIWLTSFEFIARELGMEIIDKASHVFCSPREPGLTAYVLLDASHFSVHTYASWGIAAVDFFACGQQGLSTVVEVLCQNLGVDSNHIKKNIAVKRFMDNKC